MSSVDSGRYEILGKLAEGATAELFLARAGAGDSERVVVIKRIRRDLAGNSALVHAFLDQARLAMDVHHPNLAHVFDVGKLGGSYFCTLEFIDGETLQSMLTHARTRKIEVPVRAVLALAAGTAAGLHHAHERTGSDGHVLGTVHGNLSPRKLMIRRDGIVKVIDFGLPPGAKRQLSYASPEQCQGGSIDRRSDLFSLGVMLWELLTLDALYDRASEAETQAAIESETPVAPSTRRYDIPQELDALVLKLLAKDPADRFQTAGEVLLALEALVGKLDRPLAATDLARVVRLWFGASKEEAGAADDGAMNPLVVHGEPVPAQLVRSESPLDAQLDAVRSDAAALRSAAAAIEARARHTKVTAVPQLGDTVGETRDITEQLRKRILENTPKPPKPLPAAAGGDSPRRRPETLNPQHQYAYISNVSGKAVEPLRKTGITATPPLGTAVRDDAPPATARPDASASTAAGSAATDKRDAIASSQAPGAAPTSPASAPVEARTTTDAARDGAASAPIATAHDPESSDGPEAAAHDADEPAVDASDREHAADSKEAARPPTAGDRELSDRRHGRPIWFVPSLAAGVAAVVVAVLVMTRGGAGPARAEQPSPVRTAVVTSDARVAEQPRPQVAVTDDAQPAAAFVDAQEQVAAVVVDAREQAAAVVVDAREQVAAVVVDARAESASAQLDAGGEPVTVTQSEPKHHHHHNTPTAADPPREGSASESTVERTIEQLFEAGEFAKASGACATNTRFTSTRLQVCALAACRVRDAALAHRWLRAIAKSERDDVAAKCKDLGFPLETAPQAPAPPPAE